MITESTQMYKKGTLLHTIGITLTNKSIPLRYTKRLSSTTLMVLTGNRFEVSGVKRVVSTYTHKNY